MNQSGVVVIEDALASTDNLIKRKLVEITSVRVLEKEYCAEYDKLCERRTELEESLRILRTELSKPLGERQPALMKDDRHA